MALGEKEGTGIWKMTLKIALSGELALQQTMDMFEDGVRKRDDIEVAVYWILFCIARVWIREFLFAVFSGQEVRVALYRGLPAYEIIYTDCGGSSFFWDCSTHVSGWTASNLWRQSSLLLWEE